MWPQTIVTCILFMTVWAFGWFSLAQLLRRNDIADIAWGLGFIAVCVVTLYVSTGSILPESLPGILVLSFVIIWGMRLSFHIFMRNRGKAEDYRYQKWRKEWGAWFLPRSFVQVFLLQAYMVIIVVSPALAVLQNQIAELTNIVLFGAGLWLFGFLFEDVADRQLREFLKHKKNKRRTASVGIMEVFTAPSLFWGNNAVVGYVCDGAWCKCCVGERNRASCHHDFDC